MTTLRQLARHLTTPLPIGDGTNTEALPEAYAQRLTDWAAMTGFHEHTEVRITGWRTGSDRNFVVPGHLRLPPIKHRDIDVCGWTLELTPLGRAAVYLTLLDGGLVDYEGTKVQQKAELDAQLASRNEANRAFLTPEQRLASDIARTTRILKQDRTAAAEAEEAWKDAIKAGVAGKLPVSDIARWAEISRERVYQIRDGRR